MPGSLQILDTMSREQIFIWLKDALHERVPVPREYHDQPVWGAIAAAADYLDTIARRDFYAAASTLTASLLTGKHDREFVVHLLKLITKLEIFEVVPTLQQLAADILSLKKRFGWEICNEVLFAQLNLRDLKTPDYWLAIWQHSPAHLSPVTIAALFDLNPLTALDFLPNLPNVAALGDLAVLSLDYAADQYRSAERENFRNAAASKAKNCKKAIRDALELWLTETKPVVPKWSSQLESLIDSLAVDQKVPVAHGMKTDSHSELSAA